MSDPVRLIAAPEPRPIALPSISGIRPRLLYGCTIFLSAFLLFQVQPVIAKKILPWFGGSAAVWSTCLVFFQILLLLGYLYAYWLFRYFGPKKQALLHLILLGASVLLLPIIPDATWKPHGGEEPTIRILGLLAATIGLPYFLLSTTGPLLQAWYARSFAGAAPYRFFALSNVGSVLALLSYPMIVEPILTTRHQAVSWSLAYAAFVLLCGALALRLWREDSPGGAEILAIDRLRPRWRQYLLWIALAACPSALLLAVTNHLCQDVASIPFLWVLPLALYLLSFVVCFGGMNWYRRNPELLAVALGSMTYALSNDYDDTTLKIIVFSGGLFICCMFCHGELARLKPDPRFLTSFYLMCALGGATGGAFVALLAPHVFRGYFELPLGIAACAVLFLVVIRDHSSRTLHGIRWRVTWLVLLGLTLVLIAYLSVKSHELKSESRVMARNFYGVLRIIDLGEGEGESSMRKLMHGGIIHGKQYLSPKRRRQATTYYGPESGVGLALLDRDEGIPQRVGVIGLGAGTLASYGRPGDYYRFYEINPLVVKLANSEFSFLKDSEARIEVTLGDARVSLEREPAQNFDVLAVDAFSSDSIPVHLLTREAFDLYFRHLKPRGILAVHVSNRYLNLSPVVQREAENLRKETLLVDSNEDEDNSIFEATWVLLANRREIFEKPAFKNAGSTPEDKSSVRLWTDDFSNLLTIVK
jgi:SAM-dependent methyltransferase